MSEDPFSGATDAVSATSTAVTDGNVMLSDTLRIFGRLVTSVEDISSNIEQVASMNEEQAAAVQEITSSMHEVSAMLKDTAREAVESAHATGETSTIDSSWDGFSPSFHWNARAARRTQRIGDSRDEATSSSGSVGT